jgi:hypothetical protein
MTQILLFHSIREQSRNTLDIDIDPNTLTLQVALPSIPPDIALPKMRRTSPTAHKHWLSQNLVEEATFNCKMNYMTT